MNKSITYRVHAQLAWRDMYFDFDNDVAAVTLMTVMHEHYNPDPSVTEDSLKVSMEIVEEAKDEDVE